MDWTQIEKDFQEYYLDTIKIREKSWNNNAYKNAEDIADWFKQRIESELPPQPPERLNEEEKSEFYTTNVTAEIKPKYGK